MAIPFAPILGKLSNNVGKATDEIEDKLLFINDKLYQVNSIDFCNPLGYIMGKALPPNGPVQKNIDKYAGKLKKFVDLIGKVDLENVALDKLAGEAPTTTDDGTGKQIRTSCIYKYDGNIITAGTKEACAREKKKFDAWVNANVMSLPDIERMQKMRNKTFLDSADYNSPNSLKNITAGVLAKKEKAIAALLEIKNSIDGLAVPVEFVENIPGADKIQEKLQKIKVSLDIAEGVAVDSINPLELLDGFKELQAIKTFLLPFSSPQNVLNAFFGKEVEAVNKILKDFIRPDKFVDDVEKIIKLIVAIESVLAKILSYMRMVSTIIKVINILIKIYIVIAKLLKRIPIPARYTTVGTIVKAGTKSNEMEFHKAEELRDFLKVLSNFIDGIIITLGGVRGELITMIVALEQLKQNLGACPYTQDNYLDDAMGAAISSAKQSLAKFEKEVPQIKEVQIPGQDASNGSARAELGLQATDNYDLFYLGYGIKVIREEIVDQNISILRRYALIYGPDNEVKAETDPTYASNTQVLLNEAKFIIEGFGEVAPPDGTDDVFSESDAEDILDVDLREAQTQANEAQEGVNALINSIESEKKLADDLEKKKLKREKEKIAKETSSSSTDTPPDPKRVREVARLLGSMTVQFFVDITDRRGPYAQHAQLRNIFLNRKQRQAKQDLVAQLGGMKKAGNQSIVHAISKYTNRQNNRNLGRNRDENRMDHENIAVLVKFLRVKGFKEKEIQAGIKETVLGHKFRFTIKKGRVRYKKRKKYKYEGFYRGGLL